MKRYIFCFFLVLCLSGLPFQAMACSCAERPLAEHAQLADALFIGQAVDVTYPSMHKSVTTFKIQKVLKGIAYGKSEVMLDSNIDAFSCGMSFTKGQTYLVFASLHNDRLRTDGCTLTKRLEDAEEELEELGLK